MLKDLHTDFANLSQCVATKRDLQITEDRIMATQAELTAQLNQVAVDLVETNAAIGKVSSETDTLLAEVVALKEALANQAAPTPELIAAVAAVAEASSAVKAGITLVDEKVPDAIVPA
jgi:peptidoglycan hydrolase CwlO-like protein